MIRNVGVEREEEVENVSKTEEVDSALTTPPSEDPESGWVGRADWRVVGGGVQEGGGGGRNQDSVAEESHSGETGPEWGKQDQTWGGIEEEGRSTPSVTTTTNPLGRST